MQRWKKQRRRSRTALSAMRHHPRRHRCSTDRRARRTCRSTARAHARGARRFEKAAPQRVCQQVGGKCLLHHPCSALIRRKCADASRSWPTAATDSAWRTRSFSMLTCDATAANHKCWFNWKLCSMKICTYTSCNEEQRVGTTTASAGRVPNGGSTRAAARIRPRLRALDGRFFPLPMAGPPPGHSEIARDFRGKVGDSISEPPDGGPVVRSQLRGGHHAVRRSREIFAGKVGDSISQLGGCSLSRVVSRSTHNWEI